MLKHKSGIFFIVMLQIVALTFIQGCAKDEDDTPDLPPLSSF